LTWLLKMAIIPFLFYLSGLINIVGISILSWRDLVTLYRGFFANFAGTDGGLVIDELSPGGLYPNVFSAEGCLCIMLWGLAYIAVARKYKQVPGLCLVFCLEKIFYFLTWVNWYYQNSNHLPGLYERKPLLALFFQIYGWNDAFFAVVFFIAFLACFSGSTTTQKPKKH